jgi:hypothetical protein
VEVAVCHDERAPLGERLNSHDVVIYGPALDEFKEALEVIQKRFALQPVGPQLVPPPTAPPSSGQG